MELLEVPQLMDMCVRNAVYDEALDLQSFVTRLGLLHPNVPVVKKLLQQVCYLLLVCGGWEYVLKDASSHE